MHSRIGIRLNRKVAPASSRSVAHRDRLEAGATFGAMIAATYGVGTPGARRDAPLRDIH